MQGELAYYTKQFQDTMEDLDMDIKKGLVDATSIILVGILMDQIADGIRTIMMNALVDQERKEGSEDVAN